MTQFSPLSFCTFGYHEDLYRLPPEDYPQRGIILLEWMVYYLAANGNRWDGEFTLSEFKEWILNNWDPLNGVNRYSYPMQSVLNQFPSLVSNLLSVDKSGYLRMKRELIESLLSLMRAGRWEYASPSGIDEIRPVPAFADVI